MAVIGICGLIAIGAISILLAEEFKAWAPRLINLLIRRAVRKLPDETRTRYGEEWRSHICEIPGTIGKVLTALGFNLAARRLSPRPAYRIFISNAVVWMRTYPRLIAFWFSLSFASIGLISLFFLSSLVIQIIIYTIYIISTVIYFNVHNKQKTILETPFSGLPAVRNVVDKIRKFRH